MVKLHEIMKNASLLVEYFPEFLWIYIETKSSSDS